MSLPQCENVILYVLENKPGTGKTAVMKILYMLQQVKNIKMGLSFDVYTYGPYTSEVYDHLDCLISEGYISSCMYHMNNYVGYQLNITDTGKQRMEKLNKKELECIKEIIAFTSGKTAKALELYSTIIFVDNLYHVNKLSNGRQRIVENVRDLKPRFSLEEITNAYNELTQIKYIAA